MLYKKKMTVKQIQESLEKISSGKKLTVHNLKYKSGTPGYSKPGNARICVDERLLKFQVKQIQESLNKFSSGKK